jgi:hypothetical protein
VSRHGALAGKKIHEERLPQKNAKNTKKQPEFEDG